MPKHPTNECLSKSELARLSTEQLVAYIAEMRDAGRPQCAKDALAILAFGYWDLVHYMVADKVPTADVEDVAAETIESALRSAFDGRSVGEFVNWLKVIARRRIADFHRSRERLPETTPLPSENRGDETIFGEEPHVESEAELVHIREAAGRVLERRSDVHQLVVRLYGPVELGYGGRSARDTAAAVDSVHPGETMSEANVHQIWRRFKDELEDEPGLRGS